MRATEIVEASRLKVPSAALFYIGLQWPGAAKFAGVSQPDKQLDELRCLSEPQSEALRRFYLRNLQRDWEAILPGLPPRVDAILDIGCGVAGIDALLFQHYRARNSEPTICLLDRSEVSKNLRYGFHERDRFYGSLDNAREFLVANGVPDAKVRTFEVGGDLPWIPGVGLVISLHSWGFHYPLGKYLDYVRALLLNGGVGITDLRDEKESIESLRAEFDECVVLQRHANRQRVRFVGVRLSRGPVQGRTGAQGEQSAWGRALRHVREVLRRPRTYRAHLRAEASRWLGRVVGSR